MGKRRATNPAIPTTLSEKHFNEFILPHIPDGERGPGKKLSAYGTFKYICRILHTGMQWKELEIKLNSDGKPEIHYTTLWRTLRDWTKSNVFENVFENSVQYLAATGQLNVDVVHGDGTCTAGKKGGQNVVYNGYKKHRGDKAVTICDRNCNVVCPLVAAPGNKNESPLFKPLFSELKRLFKKLGVSLQESVMSLDGAFDCKSTRKMIFNAKMIPNINENKRGRKKTKVGRKRLFDPTIFKERFQTIERVFAWEDKFKRVLIRFERKDEIHYSFKNLAYALINFRHLA